MNERLREVPHAVALDEVAGVARRLDELSQHTRVAGRRRDELFQAVVGDRRAEHAVQQRLDGVRRERRRLDAAQMAVVHEGAHFAVVRAGRADRADDERGLRVHEGHEQCTRELVELVDVVDHDDPAPPLLHLLERGAGAVEEERAVELALGPARASHLAGEKVGERGKGKTLGLGMTGDASDGQSGLGGEPQALVREPGLAQARAAADEDAARTRVTERRGDRLDLVGSAEERPRRR